MINLRLAVAMLNCSELDYRMNLSVTQFAVMHRFTNQLHAHQTKAKGTSRAGRTLGFVLEKLQKKEHAAKLEFWLFYGRY